MFPLSKPIADDRSQLFVGRQKECDWVRRWIETPDAPSQIVAVTGMGGVGKSTLLVRILHMGQETLTVWIDGRTCYRSPKGFLDALPDGFHEWQKMPDPRPRLMIAIDNYEELEVLETWLREVFLLALPATGVLVLLASRQNLMTAWLLDPGWRDRIQLWPLRDFTTAEMEDFLARREWPREELAVARRLADRHPLSLALLAEARRRLPGEDTSRLDSLVRESLSARLLREVTDPELEPLVDALTVMREADLPTLERVLGRRVSPRQYNGLRRLSFVKRGANGTVALHDLAVMHLFHDFRERDPAGLEAIRQRALDTLLSTWEPSRQGALAQQILWICRDVLQGGSQYADLTDSAPDLTVTGYQTADRTLLREYIGAWPRQSLPIPLASALRLFDTIAERFPSSIRVTREQSGRPLAVFAALPLYDQTLDLVASFHPLVVERLLASDLGISRCRLEEANALFNVLTGLDLQQRLYSPETLLGVVARDQLALQAGILGLLIVTNPELKAFLRGVGYQSRPFPVSQPPVPEEELFILDLRQQHFGAWIESLLKLRHPKRPIISTRDMRELLSHRDDLATMEESPLARALNLSPQDIIAVVRETLTAPPDPPLTERDQHVLHQAFFSSTKAAWQHAARLHVSRATYYRYLDKALEHLALWFRDNMRRF